MKKSHLYKTTKAINTPQHNLVSSFPSTIPLIVPPLCLFLHYQAEWVRRQPTRQRTPPSWLPAACSPNQAASRTLLSRVSRVPLPTTPTKRRQQQHLTSFSLTRQASSSVSSFKQFSTFFYYLAIFFFSLSLGFTCTGALRLTSTILRYNVQWFSFLYFVLADFIERYWELWTALFSQMLLKWKGHEISKSVNSLHSYSSTEGITITTVTRNSAPYITTTLGSSCDPSLVPILRSLAHSLSLHSHYTSSTPLLSSASQNWTREKPQHLKGSSITNPTVSWGGLYIRPVQGNRFWWLLVVYLSCLPPGVQVTGTLYLPNTNRK